MHPKKGQERKPNRDGKEWVRRRIKGRALFYLLILPLSIRSCIKQITQNAPGHTSVSLPLCPSHRGWVNMSICRETRNQQCNEPADDEIACVCVCVCSPAQVGSEREG